jgi:hypothetical protein
MFIARIAFRETIHAVKDSVREHWRTACSHCFSRSQPDASTTSLASVTPNASFIMRLQCVIVMLGALLLAASTATAQGEDPSPFAAATEFGLTEQESQEIMSGFTATTVPEVSPRPISKHCSAVLSPVRFRQYPRSARPLQPHRQAHGKHVQTISHSLRIPTAHSFALYFLCSELV